MVSLGTTTPYYGGGQVPNPANVIEITSSPPANNAALVSGIIACNTANGDIYISSKKGAWTKVN